MDTSRHLVIDPMTAPLLFTDVRLSSHDVRIDNAREALIDRVRPSAMTLRNIRALYSVMSPRVAAEFLKSSKNFAIHEYAELAGSASGCGTTYECTITLAAGATIVSFANLSVSGNSATVTATVDGWQQMGSLGSSGQVAGVNTPQNTLIVKETLLQQADGSWTVVNRVGDFAGGAGP